MVTSTLRLIAERSLTYAPHHVADQLGYFEDDGLVVLTDYDSGPGGSWLADRMTDGLADLARGGVWLPILYRPALQDLRLFCLLCDRNAQLLLSRRPGEFCLSDLEGHTVLLPAAATSQWMFLEGILREASVDLARIRFIRDLESSTMIRLWRSGFGDFLLAGPPASEQLVAAGHPIAGSIAGLGGRVPWSVYYTSKTFVQEKPDLLESFCRAILRAQQWMRDQPPSVIAEVVAPDFPELSRPVLTASIGRMIDNDVWVPDVRLPMAPLERYQHMISAYGLADRPLDHDQLVAPGPAERAQHSLSIAGDAS